MRQQTKHDLRCFCRRQPLLAVYGVDESGNPYVHVKIYKSRRIFGEVVIRGTAEIRCRECLRWYTVIFKANQKAILKETLPPESLDEHASVGHG